MTTRIPLVLGADGLPQQLQSGDSISIPAGAVSTISRTNSGGSAVVIGAPVYVSGAGSVALAKADVQSTSKVMGVGYDTSIAAAGSGNIADSGVLTATTTQWDAVAGTTGGLSPNTIYFLSPTTAGKITSTVPTTVGQSVIPCILGLSTTEGLILTPATPILL